MAGVVLFAIFLIELYAKKFDARLQCQSMFVSSAAEAI